MAVSNEAFYNLLGIAMRAGSLTTGADSAVKAIRSGKASLVLLDEDASDNTAKMLRDSCAYYGAQLAVLQADRLGRAIGKPGRMAACVSAGPLADRLKQLAAAAANEEKTTDA